jgi:hypothetical protein
VCYCPDYLHPSEQDLDAGSSLVWGYRSGWVDCWTSYYSMEKGQGDEFLGTEFSGMKL